MRPLNLVGQRFGKLTVIKRVPAKGNSRWLCKCDCGNLHEVLAINLKKGSTISCGCHKSKHKKNPRYNIKDPYIVGGDKDVPAGVSWNRQIKKWKVYVNRGGKYIHVGYFNDLDDAIKARRKAENKHKGSGDND